MTALLAAALMLPAGAAAASAKAQAAPAQALVSTSAQASISPAVAPSAQSATAVAQASDPTAFIQIVAGDYYSTALRADGTVWAWGRTLYGELGAMEPRLTSSIDRPVKLYGLAGIVAIATNGVGTQTGVAADGTVWEWGAGSAVQGGSSLPRQIPGLSGVQAAVPGFALKKDGTLWRWTYEQADGKATPVAVQIPGTYRFTSMIAKGDLVYAIDGAGAVWGFGAIRKPDGSGTTFVPPARLAGLPAMKQLSAYQDRIAGVDAQGRVWQAKIDFGVLYQQSKPGTVKLAGKPTRLAPSLKAAEAEFSNFDSVLIRTTGGDVWTTNNWLTGKAGKIGGWSGMKEIAAGYHHGLAIDAKGKVWGVGGNQWFEAGSPNVNDARLLYKPAPVLPAISIFVDGKPLATAYPGIMAAGRVSVPLKDTVRALGGSLKVNADASYEVTIGQSTAVIHSYNLETTVNGKQVRLPEQPFTTMGAVVAPAALFKLMGVTVAWNAKLAELSLSTK